MTYAKSFLHFALTAQKAPEYIYVSFPTYF